MTLDELKQHLKKFEWRDIEFKEATFQVPKNAYESVSAFANTEGGWLVFGVKKRNAELEILGVVDVDRVQNDFLSTIRSADKLSSRVSDPTKPTSPRQTYVLTEAGFGILADKKKGLFAQPSPSPAPGQLDPSRREQAATPAAQLEPFRREQAPPPNPEPSQAQTDQAPDAETGPKS